MKKEIKVRFVKVHLLDLEFTPPKKCKNYQTAMNKCPKGFRLPEIWELIKIYLHYDYSKIGGHSELIKYKTGKFLAIPTIPSGWDSNWKRNHEGKCYWFLREDENERETFSVFLSSVLEFENSGDEDDCMYVIYIKKSQEELKLENNEQNNS